MSKVKKFIKSPAMLVILFSIAAGLIISGSIGGARAVLEYSDTYQSQLNLYSIDIRLNDGSGVLLESLKKDLEEKEEKFAVGKHYTEPLTVNNSGTIDEYVRVIVTRYWETEDEENGVVKDYTLDPEKIVLKGTGDGWVFDEEYSTKEKLVFYYTGIVEAGGAAPELKLDYCIDISAAKDKDYDGASFKLEAEADGVQTHNAQHAITSAWGRPVTVSGGTLSLN